MNRLVFVTVNFLTILWIKSGVVEAIVGGEDATVNQFPYAVSVQTNNKHICGGAIIDRQHVLSAAQCFIGNNGKFINKKFSVVIGVINLNWHSRFGMELDLEMIYVPMEFNPRPKIFCANTGQPDFIESADIAVLKLKESVNLPEDRVKVEIPVRIPRHFPTYYLTMPHIVGFGADSVSGEEITSKKLKYFITKVIRKGTCDNSFRFTISNKHICTHVRYNYDYDYALPRTALGTCRGDNGSPLVFENEIIGILVWSRQDCNELFGPVLYTRVSSFVPFINNACRDKRKSDLRVAEYQLKNGARSSDDVNLVEITPTYDDHKG